MVLAGSHVHRSFQGELEGPAVMLKCLCYEGAILYCFQIGGLGTMHLLEMAASCRLEHLNCKDNLIEGSNQVHPPRDLPVSARPYTTLLHGGGKLVVSPTPRKAS